jgi:chromosome segregation ATPase
MYRVALILAILAAIGSLALSFTVTKPKIEGLTQDNERLNTDLAAATTARDEAVKTAKAATATAEKKAAELANTQKDLETKTEEAKVQTERANKYFAEYNKTLAEKNSAQEQLARWTALNVQPNQIVALQNDLKSTKEANSALLDQEKILNRNIVNLKNKLSRYEDEEPVIAMPGLKGRVVDVDNKWEFVILDVGSNQGALEGGQLMVRRGDKLVGKVKLVTVEANRSVANVMPGWKQGDVTVAAGDNVLY